MTLIADFFSALRFLTVLPLPSHGQDKENLARAMFFFPLVGFLIGALTLGIDFFFQKIYPPSISTVFLVAIPIILTGGIHIDGFADFCDGFFGGKDKEDILRIMKDSHIGVFGATGIVLLLLTKYQLLQIVPARDLSFLLAMTASRWSQVAVSCFLPYARPGGGLGDLVARKISFPILAGATILVLLFIILTGFWLGLYSFMGLIFLLCLLCGFFYIKIGGITGDLLGAASEMSEVFILFLLAAFQ